MNIQILENYDEMSKAAADLIIRQVNRKPDSLLCLAAGGTPVGTFRVLVQAAQAGKVDFSQVKFVGLDEWVGIDQSEKGSCFEMLSTDFFTPLQISRQQIQFFNGKAADLTEETKRIDDYIFSQGAIDLMLLGLGVNAHLGFNEPGVSFETYSHVIDLDPVTATVGQKYFSEQKELRQGITLGIRHVLNAKTVILIANGASKAEAVYHMVKGEVTNQVPASVLQRHANCHVLLDTEAAKQIS
jgi:glucosamine-6-phosphate isomerase